MKVFSQGDAFGDVLRYVIEIPRGEFDISTEKAFGVLLNGLIEQTRNALFADLYPQLRERVMLRFLNDDAIVEQMTKALRERLADMLMPKLVMETTNHAQAKSSR